MEIRKADPQNFYVFQNKRFTDFEIGFGKLVKSGSSINRFHDPLYPGSCFSVT